MKLRTFVALIAASLPNLLLAQSHATDTTANRVSLALTVYNNNLGVVRDVRTFEVKKGTSEVEMQDVPTQIDPTTVKITDHEHPNAISVSEQNYEFDLVSQQKLLDKYIDKPIYVIDPKGEREQVTLLSNENNRTTLLTANGIKMLSGLSGYTIDVPSLPGGLITKPTLVWQLESESNYQKEPLEVLYQTGGISWHAEYIASLGDDDKSLELSGWVSIDNKSGATYPDASLKLVAGNINRVTTMNVGVRSSMTKNSDAYFGGAKPQFQEHGMFEYHVYDLQRKTTIRNDEVKQVSLLQAEGITAKKLYTYRGEKNAEVTIEFKNSEDNHLGMPIPMGTIRVMKRDKDGSMEFVGEDHIDHTPRDETIRLNVGQAFDIIGERVVADSRNLGPQTEEESIEITLKNHKDEDITVDAIEEVSGNWDITKSSMDYEKKNANEIIFHVPIKARGEQKVTYTIINHW